MYTARSQKIYRSVVILYSLPGWIIQLLSSLWVTTVNENIDVLLAGIESNKYKRIKVVYNFYLLLMYTEHLYPLKTI